MPCGWEKKQTDKTRRHLNVFSTTNCDMCHSRSPDINSASYPAPKVIIWTLCEGQSLTEEWSGDKEPIDRLANKPRAPTCQSSSQPGKSTVNPSNNPCLNSPNCFLLPPLTAQQPALTLTRRVKSPLNDGWICRVSRFFFFFFSVDRVSRQISGGVWVRRRRGLEQGDLREAKL